MRPADGHKGTFGKVVIIGGSVGMSGAIYLVSVLVLDGYFLYFAIKLYRDYSDALARRTFTFSILFLSLLFAALLIDHYSALVWR